MVNNLYGFIEEFVLLSGCVQCMCIPQWIRADNLNSEAFEASNKQRHTAVIYHELTSISKKT